VPQRVPLLISTIQKVVSALDPVARDQLRVLLVSFDPEHNVPSVLRAAHDRHHLDAHWKLASAPEDEARDLAALLGLQVRRLPDGNFSHTSSVLLLDRGGSVDARADDLDAVDAVVARARILAAGR